MKVTAVALAVVLLLPLAAAPVVEQSAGSISLHQGDLAISFDNRGGCRLASLSVGDFAVLRRPQALWSAEFRDLSGRPALLDSARSAAAVSVEGDAAVLRWEDLPLPGGGTVDVRVSVRFPDAARTEWAIAFEGLPGQWTLYRYQFPCMSLAAESGRGCAFLEPHDWGTLTPDPLRNMDGNRWRVYPRCGLNMQMHGLQRGERMVYLGCHDPRARRKEFLIDPDQAGQALEWSVLQPTRLQYGGSYAQEYPFVLEVLRGDWYDAAQVYREWALTAPWTWRGPLSTGAKTPRRFLETPLVLMRLGVECLEPEFVADWMIRTRDWFGVPVACHYYHWHQNFGEMSIAAYPEYFPAVPGFRENARRMEAAGIQVMPYVNARLWRTDFESWHELGDRAAVKDIYGRRHDESYMRIPTAVMNPASRLWQWVIGETALRAVDLGCSAVYLDQVAETHPFPGYNPAHPHALGETGAWVQGYWQLLERIRNEGRDINPDLVITAEGNAEPYIAGVDGFLTGNFNDPHSVPLFSAVYHDYVTCFGRYVMAEDFPLPGATLAKFGEQFIFGAQFGWANGFLEQFLREDNPDALCLRRMAKLRAEHTDLLALGRLLRPLDLASQVRTVEQQWIAWDHPITVPLPEVLSSVWQAPDGTVGVLLLNRSDQPKPLRIVLPPELYPVAPGAGDWQVTVEALSPLLLTCAGTVPAKVTPPLQPVYDLLGYGLADAQAAQALPFALPTDLPSLPSERFPYGFDGNALPTEDAPAWLALGPGADQAATVMNSAGGILRFDTLNLAVRGAVLLRIPRGPYWQVDEQIGYTVEARLRVTETNRDERFAFWLEAHNEKTMLTLQIHPDRISSASNPDIPADMASAFRVVRLVALPGGAGYRLFLDGEAQTPDLQGVGGLPNNACVGFGAGASAGRVRAEIDYVRFNPTAAVTP